MSQQWHKINESTEQPKEGAWCWVTDGKSIWPAIYRKLAANGWSNDDCWEDFDGKITHWHPMAQPTLPEVPEVE